ncbi:dipeptide epimerase [Panacibacter sp. DH6]|uniref:Dipeptide epimerase n=1 Tax=Panacibacter microcysteis TaxID=2793269 RepID=A0A931MCW8_9BACT|nr:dipeptide epimerase [Panacibacter microcysteis]MBG9378277.1 dipeptide epimerase [Panacibacter microcysteis]
MKIAAVHAYLEKLPLTKPYTIAYKTIADTSIVFLEIVLDNGITGIGASNPFEEVVGETPLQTLENLQTDFVQQMVGKDIRAFNQLIDEATLHFKHLPGTIAAIDIALHDAFCKHIDIAVADLYGRKINALPTSVTIGIKDIAAMVDEAKLNYNNGFRVLKIKTGLHVEEDIERIVKLREAFAGDITIRVDANQGYDFHQLNQFINATATLDVELIEQPLPRGSEEALLLFPEKERKKIAADESLLDAGFAMQLAQQPLPFGIFNIKLMKCGGIKAANEIATIAKYAGIDLFWGCNDESIAGISAALHIAYACSNTKYLDLDGSFDLSRDLVSGGFMLKDGLMYCTGKAGLGIYKHD